MDKLLCPWDSPVKNTGVGCHAPFHGRFQIKCCLCSKNALTGDIHSLAYSSSVQSLSHVQLIVTPRTAACQASLSFTISRSLLKLMSIESMMLSNHLILCHCLLLLPSIFSSISVFSKESVFPNQLAKVLEFQLQYQSFQ